VAGGVGGATTVPETGADIQVWLAVLLMLAGGLVVLAGARQGYK
jgi:hypothetical protein